MAMRALLGVLLSIALLAPWPARGDTATKFIPLDGNRSNQCSSGCMVPDPSSYTCTENPGWDDAKATFSDPLPAGSVVTSVSLEIRGSYHCADTVTRTTTFDFYLNNQPLHSANHTGSDDCACYVCDTPVYSMDNVGAIKYNAGDRNVLHTVVGGDKACFGGYLLTLTYEHDEHGVPPFHCCLYAELTSGEADVTCVRKKDECAEQKGRRFLGTSYVDDCSECFPGSAQDIV